MIIRYHGLHGSDKRSIRGPVQRFKPLLMPKLLCSAWTDCSSEAPCAAIIFRKQTPAALPES